MHTASASKTVTRPGGHAVVVQQVRGHERQRGGRVPQPAQRGGQLPEAAGRGRAGWRVAQPRQGHEREQHPPATG
jgi:hypothetical protein